MGGGGVGKSALTIRLVTGEFMEEFDPTIEDSYRKNATITETFNGKTDKVSVVMDILDTAGQEEFSSMQDQWIRDGQGFLVVYSITSLDSYDQANELVDKIFRSKTETTVPIVIAGNKCDLENQRQVSTKEGQDYGMYYLLCVMCYVLCVMLCVMLGIINYVYFCISINNRSKIF